MPPKNETPTPNKPPENPTWTLDEGEEMHRDINDLKNKIVTKDDLQEMEAKLEAINTKMDGLKEDIMEGVVPESVLKAQKHSVKASETS